MATRYEGTFLDWLRQQPPGVRSPQDVAHFIKQAADALQPVHDQQVVHKDVTPASFLIRPGPEQPNLPNLQLADFSTQGPVGTPASTAPEQWHGTAVPATDQYALAVMAYQLLTWRTPFQGNQEQLMYQHLNVQPEPPSRFNLGIPPALDSVIIRALAKRPEDRYSSITAFADAFQQASQVPHTISPLSTPGLPRETIAAPLSAGSLPNNRALVSSMSREVIMLTLVFLIVVSSIGVGFYAIVKHNQVVAASLTSSHTPVPTNESVLAATVTSGKPLFADSLSSNDGHWDTSAMCVFTGGSYHVLVEQASRIRLCGFRGPTFGNVAIQVDVSLLSGNNAGLLFRVNNSGNQLQFYFFNITKQGEFFFGRPSGGSFVPLIPLTKTGAIAAANQKNTLLVIAKGSDFKLYINGIFVGEAQDSASSSGEIGFIVGTLDSDPRGDASFANFKLYNV